MRMIAEIPYAREEEEEEQIRNDGAVALPHKKCLLALPVVPALKIVVVGYALTSKKIKSFLQPKFEGLARNKGILFVAIDQSKPLSGQGPFDIVLHKLSGKEWRHVLEVGVMGIGPSAVCVVRRKAL